VHGTGGWGGLGLARVVRMATSSWPLTKRPPTLASAAEAMTHGTVCGRLPVWMGPLGGGDVIGALEGSWWAHKLR
jgi:hypothetical protein